MRGVSFDRVGRSLVISSGVRGRLVELLRQQQSPYELPYWGDWRYPLLIERGASAASSPAAIAAWLVVPTSPQVNLAFRIMLGRISAVGSTASVRLPVGTVSGPRSKISVLYYPPELLRRTALVKRMWLSFVG